MPGDCMHDVLEGVLQYEVKQLLLQLIKVKRYFTLKEFNRRTACFDFGYYNDINKPSPISENKLNSPDHCLKLHVSPNQVAYLQVLIDEHHRTFKMLYEGKPIIPKTHYMVHMPSTILRLGPLVRSWCMRFEAKHSYFKKLANIIGNFSNVAQTMANPHQRWMCYKMQTSNANVGTFVEKGVQVGPEKITFAGDTEYCQLLELEQPSIQRDSQLTESNGVDILGRKYKVGCFPQIGMYKEEPEFARVKKILVQRDLKMTLFLTITYITTCLNDHFQAYEMEKCQDTPLV